MSRAIARAHRIVETIPIANAQRKLAALCSSQKARFQALAPKFYEVYRDLQPLTDEGLISPVWEEFNTRLEQTLLPHPPYCFLRDPTIAFTMFVDARGRWLAAQRHFVEAYFGPQRTAALAIEDAVGCPPLAVWRLLSSHNSFHHLYHFARFAEATAAEPASMRIVLEWGAGYGNQAKLFHRLNPDVTYIAIDTPLMCTLQWLYLSTVLGPEDVHLLNSRESRIEPQKINIAPLHFARAIDVHADLFISTWALSESSVAAQDLVVSKDWYGATHLLLAFQEEFEMGNLRLPAAERAGALARQRGAMIEDIGPFLRKNRYAFL